MPAPHTVFTFEIDRARKGMSTEERFKAISAYDLTMENDVDQFSESIQLQHVKDKDEVENDRGLKALLKTIEERVRAAGALCDWYMNKPRLSTWCISFSNTVLIIVLVRYLKAPIYEQRLLDCAQGFVDLGGELQRRLAAHIVLGINTANAMLDQQGLQLHDIREALATVLKRLDTPRDKDILNDILTHGGAEESVKNITVLKGLVQKCDGSSRDSSPEEIYLRKLRTVLLRDLSEDVTSALDKHFKSFDRRFDAHLRDIRSALSNQTSLLESLSGGSKYVNDPHIKEIWKEMGWKTTVKARHLVLALRDFYLNRLPTTDDVSELPHQILSPHTTTEHIGVPKIQEKNIDDAWAVDYISVSYLQAIAEAIDDDGSGFISIREVNDFIKAIPAETTVCEWLAYWAAGWRSSIGQYTDKIYGLLQKIYKLRGEVRLENLRLLDFYLDGDSFYGLELLLRSSPRGVDDISVQLAQLRDKFDAEEEKKLKDQLDVIWYDIYSPSTVSMVTGPGRIERQHLKIIQLGQDHTLDPNEFGVMSNSLNSIFLSATHDVSPAIFRQMHLDPESQFRDYAFGIIIYIQFSNADAEWVNSGYQLGYVIMSPFYNYRENGDVDMTCADIPISILKYPAKIRPESEFPSQRFIESDLAGHPTDICGRWAGFCMTGRDKQIPYKGLFRVVFEARKDDKDTFLSGSADTYMGRLKMTYSVVIHNVAAQKVDFVMVDDDMDWIRCVGVFDISSATVQGIWYSRRSVLDPPPKPGSTMPATDDLQGNSSASNELVLSLLVDRNLLSCGNFWLSRTPEHLAKLRYDSNTLLETPAKARWKFAVAAIAHTARCRDIDPHEATRRTRNIHRFVDLSIGFHLSDSLTPINNVELWTVASTISPSLDQYYFSLTRFWAETLPIHL
ncbi:hypothetical protein DXG01_003954 [Tephrocybe rancida]|nr:hypothetical protein DXG01_003954 [Tephrocybe rancida]